MDARTNMIIAKGKPVSSDVISYNFNNISGKWDITFKNGKTFQYNAQNVTFLKNPTSLNPKSCQVRHNGRTFDNITAIYVFKGNGMEYWHICFGTGHEQDYDRSELQVNKSVLENGGVKQVFEYLREVAGFISVRTEDDTAILSKQYEKIDFLRDDTAATVYLNPEEYQAETDLDASAPIFPFGCNESQFKAVTNALANRISVIEGPPGTGKTQTILNIIANLVLQGKTLQVVSNNNSAIDNVIEKLDAPKYRMGFIVAQLGRDQRKDAFIEAQTGTYPDFSGWRSDKYESPEFYASVREKSLKLQEIFRDKNCLAELRKERYSVQLECDHLRSLVDESTLIITKKKLPSDKLMEFWQEYRDIQDGMKKAGWIYKLIRRFSMGINVSKLLQADPSGIINRLQYAYYETRLEEIDTEISGIENKLEKIDADALMAEFTELSLHCFRAGLAKRYGGNARRPVFTKDHLWQQPGGFTKEYPVVLSTTYTARSSLGRNGHFDYVIMDEASQADVATGMLALSCASNAVIVGDTKQLPNVVTAQQKEQLGAIFARHQIAKEYDFVQYSFLSSICAIMGERVPRVTLCEHYRCHPQIIGFCNQKFYNGELIVMTDGKQENALQLVTTVVGNHERDRMNQRQIDVIRTEILPKLDYPKSEIGIIAPYRNQVYQLKKELADPAIDVATVHKFQGREKDVIILSTVDDTVTEFSDDPNLLNVAVSRAKKKLIIVAADQEQPVGSNVGDLIGYIRYNNCEVQHSEISSVFDYLYSQYTESRFEYLKKHKRISEYDSENLMYALIQEELQSRDEAALDVVCHQPLQLLFRDQSKMDAEEQCFVNTGLSHLDFLIFNKISKQPVLAIEVDGFNFHKDGTRQAERDKLKNHILEEYDLPLLRFKTNGSGEKEVLSAELDKLLHAQYNDVMLKTADSEPVD